MTQLDWDAVKKSARALGVKEKALEKWRQRGRGVPPKWWLPLVKNSKGTVSIDALDAFNRERVA